MIDYSPQSAYSDPGAWAELFDEVEPTVDRVGAMARNLVAHYRVHAKALPESSRDDIALRWIEAMLATDQDRHGAPVTVERPLADRVQGCCRDHSLLAVSALRHHGVPARSRVGFATYFSDNWNADHVVVEAWLDRRWRRFDPELDATARLSRLPDPTDIPGGPGAPFLTSAQVWLGHRAGSLDVTRFGVAEGLGIDGDWFVHGYVICELAHRFGDELLLWDGWGAMCGDLEHAPPEDLTLVDEIAALLVRADEGDDGAERELLDRYREDARLHPGERIRSVSPNGGMYEVDLTRRESRRVA